MKSVRFIYSPNNFPLFPDSCFSFMPHQDHIPQFWHNPNFLLFGKILAVVAAIGLTDLWLGQIYAEDLDRKAEMALLSGALCQFEREIGRMPASLAELSPHFLPLLPEGIELLRTAEGVSLWTPLRLPPREYAEKVTCK